MSDEGGKTRGVATGEQPPPPPTHYYYGTFQGVANYPPPPPQQIIGFPQPAPPPPPPHGVASNPPPYYSLGYQSVPGYAIPLGNFVIEHPLPCCGVGIGWFLFLFGFFLGAVPWYIGTFILVFVRIDYREKPGLVACAIAAVVAVVAVSLGATKASQTW